MKTTTDRVLPVETLAPEQVAWLEANGIRYSKGGHNVLGYCFGKGKYCAVFGGPKGFDVEREDRSEDGEGAVTIEEGLSLRAALKFLSDR